MNDDPGPASAEEGVGSDVVLLTERLCSIVTALHGGNVGANDDELWFELESPAAVQIRLSGDHHSRCYDRSANFAIAYGGQACDERVAACFRDVVERIKAIDASPLAGAAAAFRVASEAVARRFRNPSVAADPASQHNANLF